MDTNHQGKSESELRDTEDKLWLPPLSPKDQERLKQLRKKSLAERMGLANKTIWDWLQLLIIPLVLTGGGYLYGTWQHNVDEHGALDQQRATILQTYIDNIQDLLLSHNLLKSNPFDPTNPYYDIAVLARARTQVALQGLDPERKGRLVVFLYEAKLIGYFDDTDRTRLNPIIDLRGIDLSYLDLYSVSPFILTLRGAFLKSTNLSYADLSYADLSYATLGASFLLGADLTGANFTGADLGDISDLTQQQLDQVSHCKGAILPKGLICHYNQ